MLYNVVFGCHGNTCVMLFLLVRFFYVLYSIGPINVCTDFEINRYKIDEVRKYAKNCVLFDVTWRKNGTSYVMGTSGSKVMPQIVVFVFSVTLTFDLCYIVCHTHCAWCTGISMRSFIRIRPVILGDMPWTHTQTHRHTPKVILIVFASARLIIRYMCNP